MRIDPEEALETITVEVAYGNPQKQLIISLQVPLGTTAIEAVLLSKITEEFAAIDPVKDPMGIFSKPLDGKTRPEPQDYVLEAGDRIEIYRPLLIDPKQARLARAKESKEKAKEVGEKAKRKGQGTEKGKKAGKKKPATE